MTQGEFIDAMNEFKPLIWGEGQRIAKAAGVSDNCYQQYMKGIAPVEETRIKIYEAVVAKVKEIKAKIEDLKIE